MPAPALPQVNRFFHPDLTKAVVILAVAAVNLVPTRAEINGGTDISTDIADWAGWSVTGERLATPDLGSRFTSGIGGRTSAPDSSITFYAALTGADVRSKLPRGTRAFMLIADGGDVPGHIAAVFPFEVLSTTPERSLSDAARLLVSFSITAEPNENVVLPAHPATV